MKCHFSLTVRGCTVFQTQMWAALLHEPQDVTYLTRLKRRLKPFRVPATPWGCHCAIYEGPGAVGTSLFASLQLFATTPSPTDTSRWKSFPVLSCFPFCCQSHLLNPSFLLSDLVFSPLSIYQLFFL